MVKGDVALMDSQMARQTLGGALGRREEARCGVASSEGGASWIDATDISRSAWADDDLRELSFVVQPIVELAKQPHELFHLAFVQ